MLAAAGVASRRAAEEMIAAGRVSVDGEVVRVQGSRVNAQTARIEVDGRRVAVDPRKRYLAMNKPAGYVTSARDERGRPTIFDLVKSKSRLFSVGRLDADTTGLLLLTNDGDLAHRLMHPRFQVERTYVADVEGEMKEREIRLLTTGVTLDDGEAKAVSARLRGTAKNRTRVEIVLTEGRKREVRRMMAAVGHPVRRLVRTAVGPIRLGGIPSGQTRALTPEEVGALQRLVGL